MLLMNRRVDARRCILCICTVLVLSITAGGVAAQGQTTYLDAPRDTQSNYSDVARRARVDSDIRYVDETNVDLITGDVIERRSITLPDRQFGEGHFGTIGLVIIAALVLFLFLRFGAGGMLLRPDPSAPRKPRTPVRAWGLTARADTSSDIMAQVRAMVSRREALIFLLRHCLLQAAEETQTQFQRADTEREALDRLPDQWRRYRQLRALMVQTELVHYGGREIDDDAYETALGHGAQILIEAR